MPGLALLDPSFVRELEVLRRRFSPRARSGGPGEHLAKRRGGSAEFHEHRPYTQGDDLRRIDWAAYARSGEPVLKVFRAEEDVVARMICDCSASLDFGEPKKLDVLRRLAAALGYMTLAESERAQVVVAGAGTTRDLPPLRGRHGLPTLLRQLDALEAGGQTDLARSIEGVVLRGAHPGLLAVFSDFFDAGPWRGALSRAVAGGHDVVLVQVLSAEDVSPSLEGDLALEDAETGATIELVMDAATANAYARRLASLYQELGAWARRHGATYVRARSDEPIAPVVRRMVARGVDE